MKKNMKSCLFFWGAVVITCLLVVTPITAKQGWGKDENGAFYILADDSRAIGWQKIGNEWYYFADNGVMQTGWQEVSGEKYYLGTDGIMRIGWQKIEEQWYYFDNNGHCLEDTSAEENTIKGIDVSKWQQDVNWKQVKEFGMEFAFVRLGHGAQTLDPYYVKNVDNANEVGIPVGVYFYSKATTEEQAISDAQFVIKNLKGHLISYPVVLDMEDDSQIELGKTKITDIIIAFCDEIRAAGYVPMLYCNEYWYKNYIDVSRIQDVEYWIARYAVKPSESIKRGIWQCTSTGKVSGVNGNADINFAYKDYTTTVKPRTTSKEDYSPTVGIWREDNVGKWYSYINGGYPVNQWEKIGKNYYWFDESGYTQTGWKYIDGNYYYLNQNGARVIGWNTIGNKKYYFHEDGKIATGWQRIDGSWYYFGGSEDGMATGWQKINGSWYYFGGSEDGKMATDWRKINGSWYYFGGSEDGKMATDWRKIDGSWYYFGGSEDGKMATDWRKINGFWYYFGGSEDGKMATDWRKINSSWYYFGGSEDGKMKTGWQQINGFWYYFGGSEDGKMAADTWIDSYYVDESGVWIENAMPAQWIKVGTLWWYQHEDRSYTQNDWEKIGEYWYYFDKDGWMCTEWRNIDGSWYYFGDSDDGAMKTNQWVGDYYVGQNGIMLTDTWIGVYYVDESGKWVPNACSVDLGNGETQIVAGTYNNTFEQEVIRLLNEYRLENGLNSLETQEFLSKQVDIRGYEIVVDFSHTRPNGTDCFTVLEGGGYFGMGENIAAGYQTPEDVMNGWKNSPGHNANMLNPDFKYIGVSSFSSNDTTYGIYWVQMFAY